MITFTEKGQWKYAVRYTDRHVGLTVRPVEQRGLNTRDDAGYAGLAWIDAAKAMLMDSSALGIETKEGAW